MENLVKDCIVADSLRILTKSISCWSDTLQ